MDLQFSVPTFNNCRRYIIHPFILLLWCQILEAFDLAKTITFFAFTLKRFSHIILSSSVIKRDIFALLHVMYSYTIPKHLLINITIWMFNMNTTLINKFCIWLARMIESHQWSLRLNMFVNINLHGVWIWKIWNRAPEIWKERAWWNIIHGLAGKQSFQIGNFNNSYTTWVHPARKSKEVANSSDLDEIWFGMRQWVPQCTSHNNH